MLQLKNIRKTYDTGDSQVEALKGVSIDFREHEFVSILGPSGCGKTTLLNIIGGLDRYTSGDLVINGKSTTDFSDSDWDTYRNHSIGFVFQSYNLIPHQTVLANVELALTLSGVSKAERRRRAEEALKKVGLGDQLKKKPNQMSGGQMQRVAIARAIVNDPDILLADEPTGALDTATSVQIMDILKEIAKDKLVIMVTHNPDLAAEYSTRIVRLLDGQVTDDTSPLSEEELKGDVVRKSSVEKGKRTSMSFMTALSLSFNNLKTKKGRTFMTVFAGSIGIIGIALILSLSNGIKDYIDTVQKDTLSSYPISIQRQTMDMTSMMNGMMDENSDKIDYEDRAPDRIYSNNIMSGMMTGLNKGVAVNNLRDFKKFLESEPTFSDRDKVSAVQYSYAQTLNIYKEDTSDGILQVNPSQIMGMMMGTIGLGTSSDTTMNSISSLYGLNVWSEMLDNPALLDSQYELLDPETMRWPTSYDEVVIVVNKHNELSDISLYALGLRDSAELGQLMMDLQSGKDVKLESSSYSFDEMMDLRFRVVLPADKYEKDEATGAWVDRSRNDSFMKELIKDGIQLKVVGIVKAREGAVSTSIDGTVGYTHALTEFVAMATERTELVKAQRADEKVNLLTGQEFDVGQYTNLNDQKKAELFRQYAEGRLIKLMPDDDKSKIIISMMAGMTDEEKAELLSSLSEEDRKKLTEGMEDVSGYDDRTLIGYITMHGQNHPEVAEKLMADFFANDEKMLLLCGTQEFKDYVVSLMPEAQRDQMTAYFGAMSAEDMLAAIKNMMSMGGMGGQSSGSGEETPLTPEQEEKYLKVVDKALTMTPREELLVYANTIAEADLFANLENMDGQKEQMAVIFDSRLPGLTDEELVVLYDTYMPELVSEMTYDQVLTELNAVNLDEPSSISIYAASFEAKDAVQSLIEAYNQKALDEDRESDVILYTDIVGIMMSFFTDVINAISYVLIAFVSISLVVSSIMIGIITYISVLERTKEIGILRAMGASKRDVARVFNAETLIIGVTAGLFGIIVTVLLCFPINWIIRDLTNIPILTASLPWIAAVILVVISMVLTMVAGLIPSLSASRKDPVVALRTE